MSKTISGAEYPLSKIFSKEFDFVIPPYQRPYAWGEVQAGELFDDLFTFHNENTPSEDYFLGSIVLIKEDNVPTAQVVDGQQRLTTLTILLAVVAGRMNGNNRATCWNYIREEGNVIEDIEPKPRLRLRERDADFFRQYVQELKIKELLEASETQIKTEVQRHIRDNARLFDKRISERFGDDEKKLLGFMKFIIQRCFLVAVSTPSQQSAFRVFSVLNNRGLDLLPIDILKADFIGKIKSSNQDRYTHEWEEIEEETGRDELNALFGHIRTIFAKAKAKRTLMEEFSEFVLPNIQGPEFFIDSILKPYAEAFRTIVRKDYHSSGNASEINSLLGWLSRVNNSDWMPAAIRFIACEPSEEEALKFFRDLERLVAYMHICAKYVNDRIERFALVTRELEEGKPLEALQLTESEKIDFKRRLDGNVYDMAPIRRNYVVLRLDSFVSDAAASYAPATLTIEHVLPQHPKDGSQWLNWWPDEEVRMRWIHRIANLVPLPRQKNSEAQNFDFEKKKSKYFTSRKTGTSSYALTTQVLSESDWMPSTLEKRQRDLMGRLCKGWNI